MLFFSEAAVSYCVCIMACIAFLCFIRSYCVINRSTHRCFVMAVHCILLLAISEIGELCFRDAPAPSTWRYVFSAAAYSLRPLIAFSITLIPGHRAHRNAGIFNIILLSLNTLAAFSSVLWGTVFSYDEGNQFVRGVLAPLPFVTSGIMLVEFLYFGEFRSRNTGMQESVICVLIVAFCIISAAVETVLDCKGLVTGISIASVAFYYMYFLVNRLSHDQLTDAYLRNRFFTDIERICRPTYIVSIDLNGLKSINDTHGHFAGDKALITFSDAVLSCLPPKAALYRIGGDEFAVLYQTDKEKNVIELIKNLRSKLDRSSLSFSAGYAGFSSAGEFNRAFEAADEKMYTEKRKYHLSIMETVR